MKRRTNQNKKPKIAVAGASGRIGRRLIQFLSQNYVIISLEHSSSVPDSETHAIIKNFNVTDTKKVTLLIEKIAVLGARTLINCVGDVKVDAHEHTRGNTQSLMYQTNVIGAENLATSCKKIDLKLIHISTEYVFDGNKPVGQKYIEEDIPNTDLKLAPTWYGITKAIGEKKILQLFPEGSVIVRFSQIQSPLCGLFASTIYKLRNNQKFTRATNQQISPITDLTASKTLCHIEKAIWEKNFRGIIHVSASDAFSSYETCLMLADAYGLYDKAKKNIIPKKLEEIVKTGEQKVLRPLNSILDITKFQRYLNVQILHHVKQEINFFQNLYKDIA